MPTPQELLAYYAAPGIMTDPGPHADLLADLPGDVASLVKVVQGVLLHIFWTKAYGIEALPPEREAEVTLRSLPAMLAQIRALDPRPLIEARPVERKLVNNCRHFATLLAGLLRAKGIPARARCGFGTYFSPGAPEPHYEDHWVAEYWHAESGRWIMVDAQLDAVQCEALKIDFNPLDMPRGRFVTGGEAWLLVRNHQADPAQFGIFDIHGVDFVKGNLLRDLAALNKVETLPWDGWGWGNVRAKEMTPDQFAVLDQAALLGVQADLAFDAHRALYAEHDGLRVPAEAALIDQRMMPA